MKSALVPLGMEPVGEGPEAIREDDRPGGRHDHQGGRERRPQAEGTMRIFVGMCASSPLSGTLGHRGFAPSRWSLPSSDGQKLFCGHFDRG